MDALFLSADWTVVSTDKLEEVEEGRSSWWRMAAGEAAVTTAAAFAIILLGCPVAVDIAEASEMGMRQSPFACKYCMAVPMSSSINFATCCSVIAKLFSSLLVVVVEPTTPLPLLAPPPPCKHTHWYYPSGRQWNHSDKLVGPRVLLLVQIIIITYIWRTHACCYQWRNCCCSS